jgi:anti-sigma factor RsiW
MSDRRISDSELHALVDGELNPAHQAEVEAKLSDDPEAAGRVARYRAQNAGMHALFDDVLNEDLPPVIVDALAAQGRWRRRGAAIAAAIALLVVGAVSGWIARGEIETVQTAEAPPIDTQELMVRAAMAHLVKSDEDLRLAAETDEQDIVRYVTTRMGNKVRVPQLESLGYRLVGSRVLPDTKGPAAQFVFEDADGMPVSLYVRSETARGVDITYALAEDLSMFYWNDSEHSYALVRETDDADSRDALLAAAKTVYSQIAEPAAR